MSEIPKYFFEDPRSRAAYFNSVEVSWAVDRQVEAAKSVPAPIFPEELTNNDEENKGGVIFQS